MKEFDSLWDDDGGEDDLWDDHDGGQMSSSTEVVPYSAMDTQQRLQLHSSLLNGSFPDTAGSGSSEDSNHDETAEKSRLKSVQKIVFPLACLALTAFATSEVVDTVQASHESSGTSTHASSLAPSPNATFQPTAPASKSVLPKTIVPAPRETSTVKPEKPTAAAQPNVPPAQTRRKIFLANVQGASHTGLRNARKRMNRMIRSFRRQDPDIAGFTEMEIPQQKMFRQLEGAKYNMVYSSRNTHNVLVYRKGPTGFEQIGGTQQNVRPNFSIPYLCGGRPSQAVVKLRDRLTKKVNEFITVHNPADTGRCHGNKGRRNTALNIEQRVIAKEHHKNPNAIIQIMGDFNTSLSRRKKETGKSNRVFLYGRNHLRSPLGHYIPSGRRGLDQVFGLNVIYNKIRTLGAASWTDHNVSHVITYEQK